MVTDSTGITYSSTLNTPSWAGILIQPNIDCELVEVTHERDDSSQCLIYNEDRTTLIASTTSGTTTKTFSTPVPLTAGVKYSVVIYDNGNWRIVARNISVSFPISGTNVDFTDGIYINNTYSSRATEVLTVTTQIASVKTTDTLFFAAGP